MKFILFILLLSATTWAHDEHDNQDRCHWITGVELKNKVPSLSLFLIKLKNLDWYFTADISNEIENLSYCEWSEQPPALALRRGNQIYLDMEKLLQLSTEIQIQILTSKIVISYRLNESQARNLSSAFEKVMNGTLTQSSDLHYQFKQNGLLFPLTAQKLIPYRAAIEFLLLNPVQKLSEVKSDQNFNDLRNALRKIPKEDLHKPHLDRITKITTTSFSIKNIVQEACQSPAMSVENLQSVLLLQLQKPTVIANCLQIRKDQPSTDLDLLLLSTLDVVSNQPQVYWTELFRIIGHYTIGIKDDVVVIKGGLTELSTETSPETQILKYLEPLDDTTRNAKGFVNFIDSAILHLSKMENGSTKLKTLIRSQEFNWAFNTKSTEEWIGMQKISVREKSLAIRNLKLLHQYFWDRLLYGLWSSGHTELTQKLRQWINEQDLGYKI